LLIAAGKNPFDIARQMGHYSAGFTLEVDGHLMNPVPAASCKTRKTITSCNPMR
jgi:hypothetical protein